MPKTRVYDSAEYLDSPEAIAEYLTDTLEAGDTAVITHAIGTAARARGVTEVAREAGVSRENLYRALNGTTKPECETIRRVLDALGVKIEVKPKPWEEPTLVQELPEPRYTTSKGVHKYDMRKAEEWVKAGKVVGTPA